MRIPKTARIAGRRANRAFLGSIELPLLMVGFDPRQNVQALPRLRARGITPRLDEHRQIARSSLASLLLYMSGGRLQAKRCSIEQTSSEMHLGLRCKIENKQGRALILSSHRLHEKAGLFARRSVSFLK